MTTAAQAQQLELLAAMRAATTVDAMAGILAGITVTGPVDGPQGKTTPGFPTDSAPGHYYNGHLFATFAEDGSQAFTEVYALSSPAFELWGEVTAAAARRRRGRPEIGRPVQVRLSDADLVGIDWYAQRHGGISRAEAIRRMVQVAVIADKRAENLAVWAETGFPAGAVRVSVDPHPTDLDQAQRAHDEAKRLHGE